VPTREGSVREHDRFVVEIRTTAALQLLASTPLDQWDPQWLHAFDHEV
jgi:hypothetical protein